MKWWKIGDSASLETDYSTKIPVSDMENVPLRRYCSGEFKKLPKQFALVFFFFPQNLKWDTIAKNIYLRQRIWKSPWRLTLIPSGDVMQSAKGENTNINLIFNMMQYRQDCVVFLSPGKGYQVEFYNCFPVDLDIISFSWVALLSML